ncbi:sigma 54-interacting transcriptional regulator [Phocaeicola vulgatus]|uniref:sigma 54-interacting transcriptional regulator n=1 Tax=Phocaeicola vulgatus TaxID=821 RepID=UPI003F9DED27
MERSGNFYKAIQLGYILISILIGCMAYNSLYEWQEIEALELGNKKIDELRKEINNINIQMIKFSLLGETILEWNDKDIEHHHLHDKSKRAVKPFVAVDCGSLTKELAPSAFFGHVKGAFTGADCAKKGYFHEAEGGTLFLDEVGNLALETQQMLLRAIQERRYRPVGDKADRSFNVRIIAATNEDLEAAVSEKRFRQDLLYRLHDFGITVPPLRDCQEDIMPLAEFFRDMANRELECSVSGFSSEARKALLTHAWPGNVRELRQKVMGAVLQAQEGVVMKEHLELAVTKPTSTVNFALRNDAEDKERILRALKQANGNRSVAAELLGIGRTTLYSKLEEYGLKYKFKQS